MFGLSPMEMMIFAVIGLLLFGSRLPEVARSAGKGMREFKEGMSGVQNEFHSAYSGTPSRSSQRTIPERPSPDDDVDDEPDLVAPQFSPPPPPESREPAK